MYNACHFVHFSENKYKYNTSVDGEQMNFEVLDTRSVVSLC